MLTPTFRYHPSVVAQAFGTLGAMFPGRVVLGVGTGEGLNEVPSTGMAWPETKERFARLREANQLIRKLWTEDRLSFEGQFYRTENATIYDKPDKPVPIYVAAAGPQVAKYAGRSAQGFICTSGKAWKLYTETLLPNVEEGLKLASNPPAEYDRMIEMKVSFDTDRDRAMQDTRHWAALALTPEEKMSVEDPMRDGEAGRALPVERAASRWIVSIGPGRAYREDPAVRRNGLPAPGVPRAGPGPGAVPAALQRAGAAEAAAAVRLSCHCERSEAISITLRTSMGIASLRSQ